MDAVVLLNKLVEKIDLTAEEAQRFLVAVMKGEVDPPMIAAILTALRMKGESAQEIVGFIKAMRANMLTVRVKDAVDVCGTGGDGAGTLNISTAAAFVIAGAGVGVAKHGNRAASSQVGGADVLEELGVNIQLNPQQAEQVFNNVGMVFLFAPLFHPATKQVVQVRKQLKIRTVFNFLGPFVNPASTKRQLIGVPNQEIAATLAAVAKTLAYNHLLIVTSEDGLDEVSISSNTVALEIKNDSVKKIIINPEDYGIKKVSQKEILGGSLGQNAAFMREILEGKKGPKRDIVALNSACGLYIAGAVTSIQEGIKLAEHSIDTGAAKSVLEKLVTETQKYA